MEKIDIYEFFKMLRDNTIEQYNTREECENQIDKLVNRFIDEGDL